MKDKTYFKKIKENFKRVVCFILSAAMVLTLPSVSVKKAKASNTGAAVDGYCPICGHAPITPPLSVEDATCTLPTRVTFRCSNTECNNIYVYYDKNSSALGHNYELTSQWTQYHYHYKKYDCSRCGDSYTDSTQLSDHDWTIEVEPTCISGATYRCTICGQTRKDEGLRGSHNYYVSAAPTTTHGTQYTCSVCNISYYDDDKITQYTVKFNSNGGSGNMNDMTVQRDTNTNLTTNTFAKTNCHFTGWNTKADGSGISYSDKQTINNITNADETITLYAQWADDKYTISYNANGGSGSMSSKVVKKADTVKLDKNTFSKTGYHFVGWSKKADGSGTIYSDEKQVQGLANDGQTITLYAQWTLNNYTVTFNGNGHTGNESMETENFTYNTSKKLLTNKFTKTGYTFKGWSKNKSAATIDYTNEQKVNNLSADNNGNVILYATWEANHYNIKFDANTGTGSMEKQKMTYDAEAKKLNKNTFTKTGYLFTGWNTQADGKGTSYTNETEVRNLTSTANGTVTLYAQWSQIHYSISFDANSGSGTMTDIKNISYDSTILLPANEFTKTGYTFKGWSKDKNAVSADFADKQEIKNLSSNDNETVKLYAIWEANKNTPYTVKHYCADITGILYGEPEIETLTGTTDTVVTPETKTYIGFTSPEKQSVTVNGDGSTTVSYYYTRNKYILSAEGDEGISSITGTGEWFYESKQHLTASVAAGYTFDKWTDETENELSTNVECDYTMKANDAKLYAKTTANHYCICFDANTGTGNMDDMTDVIYNKSTYLPENKFIKAGYTFEGWSTDKEAKRIDFLDEASVKNLTTENNGKVTFYAVWSANNDTPYTVKHYREDITGKAYETPETEKFVGTTDTTVNPKVKIYVGFTSPATQSAIINGDGSTEITYHYTRNKYNIAANGDIGISDILGTGEFYYQSEQNIKAVTAKGYTFDKWTDDKDVVVSTNAAISYTVKASDSTLHANTVPNKYIIKFDVNGGKGHMEDMNMTYDQYGILPESSLNKVGYVFAGWNTQANGSGTSYDDMSKLKNLTSDADGKVTLYAQWKANVYTIKFDANSGIGSMDDLKNISYDEKVTLPENIFSKQFYDFAGWSTDKNAVTSDYIDKEKVLNLSTDKNGLITLYAVWVKKPVSTISSAKDFFGDYDTIKSSDENIFRVDENNDIVSGKDGSVTVKVIMKDQSEWKYDITVKDGKIDSCNKELISGKITKGKELFDGDYLAFSTSEKKKFDIDENDNILSKEDGIVDVIVIMARDKSKWQYTITTKDGYVFSYNKKNITGTLISAKDIFGDYSTIISSDKDILDVDENGNIISKKDGTVTVEVTDKDGLKTKYTVTVKEGLITSVKKEIVDTAKNIFGNYDTIISSDKDIFDIDEDGNIISKKDGTVTVEVINKDGSKTTYEITIKNGKISKIVIKIGVTGKELFGDYVSAKSSNDKVFSINNNDDVVSETDGAAIITVIRKDGSKDIYKIIIKNGKITSMTKQDVKEDILTGTDLFGEYNSYTTSDENIFKIDDKDIVIFNKNGTVTGNVIMKNGNKYSYELTIQNGKILSFSKKTDTGLGITTGKQLFGNYKTFISSDENVFDIDNNDIIISNKDATVFVNVTMQDGTYMLFVVTMQEGKVISYTSRIDLDGKLATTGNGLLGDYQSCVSSDDKVFSLDDSDFIISETDGTSILNVIMKNGDKWMYAVTMKRGMILSFTKRLVSTGNGNNSTTIDSTKKNDNNTNAANTVTVKGIVYRKVGNKAKAVKVTKPYKKKTKLTIQKTVKIGNKKLKVTEISKNLFKNNKKVKSVTIKATSISIKANAFKNCKKLSKVKLQKVMKLKITKNVFKGCKKKIKFEVSGTKSKKKAAKMVAKFRKTIKKASGLKKYTINYKKVK